MKEWAAPRRSSLIKDTETSRLIFPNRTLKSKGGSKTQDPPRQAGRTVRTHGSRLATVWSGSVARSKLSRGSAQPKELCGSGS